MSDKKDDFKVVSFVAIIFLITRCFYHIGAYGAVLLAVYGCGLVELHDRISAGRRISTILKEKREHRELQ